MTAMISFRHSLNPCRFSGRYYALAVLVLSVFVSAAVLFGASAPSFAQGLALAVVPGVADGVTEQEWADIVEESAFLVEDFGLYTVNRYYEMEAAVGTDHGFAVCCRHALRFELCVRPARASGAQRMGRSGDLPTGGRRQWWREW